MSPLLDSEQLILRLQHLKEYLKFLKLLQKFSLRQIEEDPFKKGALLHYLQLSAEICIDLGEMIIAAENFEIPPESVQIFLILSKEKILSSTFAKNFSAVARFRNLLVHEYVKIDMKKVYDYLQQELGQFEIFARAVAKYARGSGEK